MVNLLLTRNPYITFEVMEVILLNTKVEKPNFSLYILFFNQENTN